MKNQTCINQLLTVLLLLCVLFVCMAGTAMAEEDCAHVFADGKCTACGVTGGYCGAEPDEGGAEGDEGGAETDEGGAESVWWTLADGNSVLTIGGTGAMADYAIPLDRPWHDSCSGITSLSIEEGVTRIGEGAFVFFEGIESVTIPASVQSLGRCAFDNCAALKTVTFAQGSELTTIDYSAFQNCEALTQITLPAGVESFHPTETFSGCSSLTDIYVAEGNATYKSVDGVLYTADGTTLVLYPEGKTAESFTTPAGVTTIGQEAFSKQSHIRSIILSKGVTTIGDYAFQSCSALNEITIPAGVTSIGDCAFEYCRSLIEVSIPASVTSIGYNAFSDYYLETVNVPCNWDDTLYTFPPTVKKTTIILDRINNGDGTHDVVCKTCGYVHVENEPHTYNQYGICDCKAVKTYTVTLRANGAKIVEINDEAKEISNGGTFTVPHGQELTVKLENTLSKWETGVQVGAGTDDDSDLIPSYEDPDNILTIPDSVVNQDFYIGANAYVRVQFNLHGGELTAKGNSQFNSDNCTWNEETTTLKAYYNRILALSNCLQLDGHTFAGAQVEGSDEVETATLVITGDMTVDILWNCTDTTTLTPVEAKAATCTEAGNIAHYTCTCGKLYAEDKTTVLTPEQVKIPVDPDNHIDMDSATGECQHCGKFVAVAKVEFEGSTTYHATLGEALIAANGKTAAITMLAAGGYGYNFQFNPSSNVTLDLNGQTLTMGATLNIMDGATLTITGNGTYEHDRDHIQAVQVLSGGTLTIENGTFEVMGDGSELLRSQGTLNIQGGTFTANAHHGSKPLVLEDQSIVTVTGAPVFDGPDDYTGEHGYISYGTEFSLLDPAKLDLSGVKGNMDGWRVTNEYVQDSVTVGQNLILPDGYALKVGENFVTTLATDEIGTIVAHTHEYTTPKFDETHHWDECACGAKQNTAEHTLVTTPNAGEETHSTACACGYQVGGAEAHAFGTDNKCTACKAQAVAKVEAGGTATCYTALETALGAARSGSKVTLLASVELTSEATIPSYVTFNGGEFTLSGEKLLNNGIITGGTFTATVTNWTGDITGGTFDTISYVMGDVSGQISFKTLDINGFSPEIDLSQAVHIVGARVGIITNDLPVSDLKLPDGYALEVAGEIVSTLLSAKTGTIVAHEHGYTYTDQGDGTHSGACPCGAITAAEPHTFAKNDEDEWVCVCGLKAVASITSGSTVTEYTDFAKALENWTDGTTLTLLDDVTYDAYIEPGDGTCTFDGGNHTLDLAGNSMMNEGTLTIQNANITANAAGAFAVENMGTMMIKESTLTNSEGAVISNRGSLTVENAELNAKSACLSTNGNTAALTNCTLVCQEIEIEYTKGKLTIDGDCDGWEVRNTGDVLVSIGTDIFLPEGYYMFELTEPGTPERLVNSLMRFGTIRAHEHKYTYTDNHDGTHSYGCTCGLATVDRHDFAQNAAGEWVCDCKAKAVAKVGGTYYVDFAKAAAAWTGGTTLTLLDDVSYDSDINLGAATRTFVGGEHTLTLTDEANRIYNDGTLTIASGTIISEGSYAIQNSGTLNIEGGTVSATAEGGIAVMNNSGTLTITGGKVSAMAMNGFAITNNGDMILDGGTIEGCSCIDNSGTAKLKRGTVTASDGYALNNFGTATLSGADLATEGNNPAVVCNSGKTTISGGTLAGNGEVVIWRLGGTLTITTNGCKGWKVISSAETATIGEDITLPEGYCLFNDDGKFIPNLEAGVIGTITEHTHKTLPIDNKDGKSHDLGCACGAVSNQEIPHFVLDAEDKCVCGAQLVAKVGEAYYSDIAVAMGDWANNGGTMTLLDDVSYGDAIELMGGSYTFNGDQFTLNVTPYMVSVYEGATLNCTGGTLKGAISVSEGATLNVEGGTIARDIQNHGTTILKHASIIPEAYYAIVNHGTLTISDSTMQCYNHDTAAEIWNQVGGTVTIDNTADPDGWRIKNNTSDAMAMSCLTLPTNYYVFMDNEAVTELAAGAIGIIRQHSHSYTATADDDTDTITYACTCGIGTETAKLLAPAETLVYNGMAYVPTVEVTGSTVEPSVVYTQNGQGVAEMKNAGDYTAIINWHGKEVSMSITILPADIENATVTVAEETYTGFAITPTYTVIMNEELLGQNKDYTVTFPAEMANAGEKELTFIGMGNYTGTKKVPYTINKATPTVTPPEAAAGLTYSGFKQQLLSNSGYTTGGTLLYSLDGQTWSEEVPMGMEVGDYTVYYKVDGGNNYESVEAQSLTASIGKADAGVENAPKANNRTYDGTEQPLVTAGSASAGQMVYSLEENGTYTENIPTAKNAGDYTVWYYVQGGDNYHDGEKASVKVTIAPIMLEVSGDGVAYAKTYDGTTSADTAAWKTPIPSVEGDLVLGDELQVTADLFPAYTTSKVGSYDAEIGVELRGKDAQNYKLTADKVAVTAIIEPKPLTATAVEGSRAYDATAEWVAPLVLDGVIGSDDVSGWAEFQLPGINVGEYTEATLWEEPELTGADAGNYTVAPQDVTFVKATITKAAADKWSVNVAAQEVLEGSGLNAVVVPATGTGIGSEVVQITAMALYSDAELQTPATDADISSLAEGESITLYYEAAADNYEAATGPMTVKAIAHQHEWTYAADEATDTITATCGGTIGTCPSAEQSITLNAPDAVYSGNPVEAEVTRDGEDLTYTLHYTGADYDSADAPANAGDYTVTMTVGDKSVSDTFTISPKDISVVQSIRFSLAQTSFVYSGEAPALNVTGVDSSVGNYTMQENTDYTVGTVQVNAGSHKLTVTGMGNYTGSVELAYEINRAPIGAAVIAAEAQVYTGEALEPAFTVELNGKTLKHNVDFTYNWTNNVNVGEGKIVINGIGNYEGQAEGTFVITSAPADLTAETYLGETMTGDFTYGDVITIKGAVTVDQQNTFSQRRAPAANEVVLYLEGGNEVIAGPVAADPATGEFTLAYDTSNKDIDIGQRNLTLVYASDGNKQDTTGSLTVTLNPKELTATEATAATRAYESDNTTVSVTAVTISGVIGTDDVKVDATNLTGEIASANTGTYTTVALADLTLTGSDKAFYTISDATVTTSAEIMPKEITSPTIVLDVSSFVYDGTEKKPAVTSVKDGDDLIDAAEYTVSYANNIEMGTATVTLTDVAGGNYTVSGSTIFQITQSGTEMTATADKNSYTYGETITVTGTVKATGTAPAATLTLRSAPAAQQVALFAADGTQLTDPVNVVEGAYTLTYNTADKGILPAEAITLTVKFVGDDNMADQSAAVTVALTAKSVAPVLTGTASKAYDGTATVTDAGNLTINLNGIIAGDTVSATAAGYAYADETVGQSKAVTAKGITLSGADSIFYTLAQTEASANIGEIKKAMLIGLTEPADTTLDVYCADADAVIGKLPDTVVYHLADGKTIDLKVEWSCTAYDSTPGATNTFAWAVSDSEKLACYEIAQNVADDGTVIVTNSAFLPVTVTGTDTAITYNGTTYDVTQMFAIDSNAGAVVFEIIGGGTGEGTLNGSVLTITKAGTITIKVTTAPNAAYAAGEATAVLTISKGTPAVTVPTGLTAWYGQKISDIVLPTVDGGAWSWTDTNSTVGDAGVQTHQAVFTPADTNLWNITTHPVNITVAQSGTSFGEMKVYNGNAETTTFTYGETITVMAEATAVRPAAFSLRSLLAPAKHQMALFIRTADGSEVQISEAVNEQNGVYTMTYNTAGKALKIGDNALVAKFTGDENMADYQETVLVTLNPKELTIASLTAQDRVYEPGNQQVAITGTEVSGKADANDDVSVLTDGMTATINSENVGTYDTALIPQDVSLTGNDAGYYFARGNVAVSIPKGVEITQATPYTQSGAPAQPVFEPIYQDGQTLGDIPVSLPAGTFNVAGTIEWEAPGDTPVTEGTPFTWVFTPDAPNWKPVTGTVVIYPDGEPPVITAPAGDQDVTVYEGEQGTMVITAADATSYQWYINRYDGLGYVPISGATSARYTTSVVNIGNDGFTYYCVASNAYGETESPVFLLQVLKKIEVPETGDEFNIALWTALMLLSIAGLTIITMNGRRSKRIR